MTSSCSISRAFGVSSSLILRPSKRKRREDTGTPTLSLYDFLSLPICVVCLTLKWISLESWPTTFSLMYSVSSPILYVFAFFVVQTEKKCHRHGIPISMQGGKEM
eukprot:TRINITY_DN538_c0_g1_i7.p1 TRINITY_DN538_c0_g1~~TRINITY_DN538_c0_g1_i7.p1  ORF type:complete len:105 (+),score=4.90 TRINITY_DN538_c0_g1_i7:276-590(+)